MEAGQCDPEPAQRPSQDGKAFGESQIQKPHEACEADAQEALEAYEVEGKDGRDKEKSEKKKKKNVSKVWSHFYLEPTMLRSGFECEQEDHWTRRCQYQAHLREDRSFGGLWTLT